MEALGVLRGFAAGLAAASAMAAVEALAWVRWGRQAVFEWMETEALAERLLGRRSMRAGLAPHVLFGGAAGIVFVIGSGRWPLAPALVVGPAFGFLLWLLTLVIHEPVTGSPARGIGIPVSLVSHLLYGVLLGLWA